MIERKRAEWNQRATVAQPFTQSQVGTICSICSLDFEPGDKVIGFACHKTHMLHIECYEELKKFADKNKAPLTCPICRKKVEETEIVKKELVEAEIKVEMYDPFAVDQVPVVLNPEPKQKSNEVSINADC